RSRLRRYSAGKDACQPKEAGSLPSDHRFGFFGCFRHHFVSLCDTSDFLEGCFPRGDTSPGTLPYPLPAFGDGTLLELATIASADSAATTGSASSVVSAITSSVCVTRTTSSAAGLPLATGPHPAS